MGTEIGKKWREGCVGCGVSVFPAVPHIETEEGEARDEGDDDDDVVMVDAPSAASRKTNGTAARRPSHPAHLNKAGHAPNAVDKTMLRGASESGRYRCENCGYHFCIHCDVLFHQTLHNCPGCLGRLD